MVRKYVNLTQEQWTRLSALAEARRKQPDELIREAIERYLEACEAELRDQAIKRSAGLWKDRTDLPDFQAMRKEWDRDFTK